MQPPPPLPSRVRNSPHSSRARVNRIEALNAENGSVAETDPKKAEELSCSFATTYTQEDKPNIPNFKAYCDMTT